MSSNSSIEWCDCTWNPVSGCTRVSAGCDHCYAVKQTYRLERMGQRQKYGGLTVLNRAGDRHFNGVVRCSEASLAIPLKWRTPRKVFVNSMSDLFHEGVPFDFIDKVFAVMALSPAHTFQILTKRPERMAEYLEVLSEEGDMQRWINAGCDLLPARGDIPEMFEATVDWPLPNVWLGTSCENQKAADDRIPHLLRCPAAVRFLSCEPLLGAIDLSRYIGDIPVNGQGDPITSGEGVNSPIVRSIVSQCKSAGVPVFVKQLGAKADCAAAAAALVSGAAAPAAEAPRKIP